MLLSLASVWFRILGWEYIIRLAILETVFAAHLFVLYPGDHVAVAYALPLLFAVWRFSPLWALGFSVVALALHALDAWMDGTQTLTWGAETLVIASVGALGVQVAERFRTHSPVGWQERLARQRGTKRRFLGLRRYDLPG